MRQDMYEEWQAPVNIIELSILIHWSYHFSGKIIFIIFIIFCDNLITT